MKLMVFGGSSVSTTLLVNSLIEKYGEENIKVIIENSPSRFNILKKRLKRLGLGQVIGQVIFMIFSELILKRVSRKRIYEILKHYQMNAEKNYIYTSIPSVNDKRILTLVDTFLPSIIVVNGTRIINKKTINNLLYPIINIHAGFTPNYRGVHGGYWALYEGHPDLVATTIHHLDSGIDTGRPIRREVFQISRQDNFATYPYLHIAAGIKALHSELDIFQQSGRFSSALHSEISKLYSHPTIFQYLKTWLTRGVK